MQNFCVILFLSVVLSSCAAIKNGRMQEISVSGNPAGATIFVDGVESGITPAILKLKRNDSHSIVLKKEGYQDQDFVLTSRTSGWIWGNLGLLPLAPVGFIVDYASGSAYKLMPATVSGDMKPEVGH